MNPAVLSGKIGLVTGLANDKSIAWGVARACASKGAELVLTYQNDKARQYTAALAESLPASLFEPLDVTTPGSLEALMQKIVDKHGKLDFLVHSMAFAPLADLHGRVTDCSLEGFQKAMDISVHSLIRMARAAEPLMKDGGSIVTMSYLGAERVVPNYGIMGVCKAALESATRYLADELGPKGIRVNAVSPGPMPTRAASGIAHFDELMESAIRKAPLHRLATLEQVGELTAFLVSAPAAAITGSTIHADGGYHIEA